jgi:hypothetical protein
MEKVSHKLDCDVSQASEDIYGRPANARGSIQRYLRILREKFIGISPHEWAPADTVFGAASYAENLLGTLSSK